MLRHETTRLINGGALQASDKLKKVTCIMYYQKDLDVTSRLGGTIASIKNKLELTNCNWFISLDRSKESIIIKIVSFGL